MHVHLIRALTIPAAVLGMLVLAGGAAAAPGLAHPAGAPGPPPTAFVTNSGSNTVTPINTVTNRAGSPIRVGTGPGNILITPNGKTAYIAGSTGVTPVSTVTHKAGKLIAIKYVAASMAITPNGKTLYIASFSWSTRNNTVTPVSTATGKVGKPITWQPGSPSSPARLLVAPNGKTLYIASTLGTVTPVSIATGKAGKPITFESGAPYGTLTMAITPSGKTLYASISGANQVYDTVTPISTATNKAGKPIKVGQWPSAIVISPNGKMAYVASTGEFSNACIIRSPQCDTQQLPSSVPATVTPVSTATNRPGKAIILGPTAYALTMVITPNGEAVYVGDSWAVADRSLYAVIPISTVTGKAGKPIKVGWAASAMAVTANSKTIYCVGATSSGQGYVTPISTATGALRKAIRVGKSPAAIAIAP